MDIIYWLFSIMILFPVPILHYSGVAIFPIYFLIPLTIVILPIIIKKKTYWLNPLTKIIWLYRFVMVFIFFVSSFQSISIETINAFGFFLGVTILFEFCFIFNLNTERFFCIFNKVFVILLVYCAVIIGYYFIKINYLIYIVPYVRRFITFYPNKFAVLLVIHFWMRKFYLKSRNNIVDIGILIMVFVSLSRTAILVLMLSLIIYFIKNYQLNLKTFLKLFLVLIILGVPIYISLNQKAISDRATLERTFSNRMYIWSNVMKFSKDNLFLGAGFKRSSEILNFYNVGYNSIHNSYIEVLIKSGVIGLLSFIMFIGKILLIGNKYSLSLLMITSILLVSSIFQNHFTDYLLVFYMYYNVCFLYKMRDRSKKP